MRTVIAILAAVFAVDLARRATRRRTGNRILRRGAWTMTAPTLTAAHRCDLGCGAQARVRVILKSGRDLLFCKHHFDTQPDTLIQAADSVINECRFILGQPEGD